MSNDTALQAFTTYLVENYPPGCVLSSPSWHAEKLFRAAKRAIKSTAMPCNGSCDISLASRQVGPDGVVPGNARECAELWEREASRLRQDRAQLAVEMDALRAEIAELKKPDQWWDWNDSEHNIDSLEDWLDEAGMQITGGEVYRFLAARTLPNEYYEAFIGLDGQAELKPTTKEAWEAHRLLQSRKP